MRNICGSLRVAVCFQNVFKMANCLSGSATPFVSVYLLESVSICDSVFRSVCLPVGQSSCLRNCLLFARARSSHLLSFPLPGARFLNINLSSLLDKWYGESQKRVEALFTLALKVVTKLVLFRLFSRFVTILIVDIALSFRSRQHVKF